VKVTGVKGEIGSGDIIVGALGEGLGGGAFFLAIFGE
jgi:hypothetical protein